MNDPSDEKLVEVLRKAIGPLADSELKRDLWPRMLHKLEQPAAQVAWFDWALGAIIVIALLLFPNVIPALLYQL